MIRVNRHAEPRVLIENRVVWTAEYIEWRNNPMGAEPRRYAHHDIRDTLRAETHSKCAYCEARIGDVAFDHIEHKLPKSSNPTLVCSWHNLTIACPKCNTYKGQYDEPQCPLLDPHVDDVENDIAFFGPMALPYGSDRADATVSRLRLNRPELLYERTQLLDELHRLLNLIQRAADEPALRIALWLHIDTMTDAAGQFASACRYFLAAQLSDRGIRRP